MEVGLVMERLERDLKQDVKRRLAYAAEHYTEIELWEVLAGASEIAGPVNIFLDGTHYKLGN